MRAQRPGTAPTEAPGPGGRAYGRPVLWLRRSRTRPSLVGEVAIVVFLLAGYNRVAVLAAGEPHEAVARGRDILALERLLGIEVELPLNALVAGHERLGQVLAVYYDFAHASVTITVLGLVYLLAPPAYRRARSALVTINLTGLAVYFLIPVAPPRLLPGEGFVDVVAQSGTWGAWEAASTGAEPLVNVYAAMPSLHVAWALWVVLAVRSLTDRPVARALAGAHLALTITIVVVTGNHYLLDVAGGAALTAASWAAVGVAGRRLPGRAGAAVAGGRDDALPVGD